MSSPIEGRMSTVSKSRKEMLAHLMERFGIDRHLAAEVLYRADSGYCDVSKDGETQRPVAAHGWLLQLQSLHRG